MKEIVSVLGAILVIFALSPCSDVSGTKIRQPEDTFRPEGDNVSVEV